MKFAFKVSTLCLLTTTLLFGSINRANAGAEPLSRNRVVDSVTDWVFYNVNPELNRRKLGSNEYGYIREWQTLRSAIDQKVIPAEQACFRGGEVGGWEFSPARGESFEQAYDDLADVIFNSRNPQRQGRRISRGERAAAQEWSEIRSKIHIYTCGM